MLKIDRLEQLIKSKGWSNVYFSNLLGKNAGWIKDMKRGRGLPDENTLEQIADKLDTTVEYLTDKTDIKNKPTTPKGNEPTEHQKKYLDKIDRMNHTQEVVGSSPSIPTKKAAWKANLCGSFLFLN